MGYLFILITLAVWMVCGLIRHNRNNSYASDRWTDRHIDNNGNYRA